MKLLRTPDECFGNLAGYPFQPNYIKIRDNNDQIIRMHYIDEGARDAELVLLMHGEPTWSYLYRNMIPIIVDAGYRVIAPDLVGFGRSDKPADRNDYTYQRHVDWMQTWLKEMHLRQITLVCQDWGGLIGLRLVAQNLNQFSRVVAANTALPTVEFPMPEAFMQWRKFSLEVENFDIGAIVTMGCTKPLTEEVAAAYNAPFPDESYKAGARIFPSLVPISPEALSAKENREAWKVLEKFEKPFVTMFSDGDPITHGGDRIFQKRIKGAESQPHILIKGGGHFLQEDCGPEFAKMIVNFISQTS